MAGLDPASTRLSAAVRSTLFERRKARAGARAPMLGGICSGTTWMAGTSPAMTPEVDIDNDVALVCSTSCGIVALAETTLRTKAAAAWENARKGGRPPEAAGGV